MFHISMTVLSIVNAIATIAVLVIVIYYLSFIMHYFLSDIHV